MNGFRNTLLKIWPGLFFFLILAGFGIFGRQEQPYTVPKEGKPWRLSNGYKFAPVTALAFDSHNRPYMLNDDDPDLFGVVRTISDKGFWNHFSFLSVLRDSFPRLVLSTERNFKALSTIAFDDHDHLYAIIWIHKKPGSKKRPVLLYSRDYCHSFQVYDLPDHIWRAALELRTGANYLFDPPAIGVLQFLKKGPASFASYNRLSVFLPKRTKNGLDLGAAINITDNCFQWSNHTGGNSFAVSAHDEVFVTFGELDTTGRNGNPIYVSGITKSRHAVTAKKQIATAWPDVADGHSTPVITMDYEGTLHAIAGAHNSPFYYTRSVTPLNIDDWQVPVAMNYGQTYATLVCDSQNALHSVFRVHPRLWGQSLEYGRFAWQQPEVLVNPPEGHQGYTNYRHRLFIDRDDALYCTFTFYETETKEQGEYPMLLIMSTDGGETWKKASRRRFYKRFF